MKQKTECLAISKEKHSTTNINRLIKAHHKEFESSSKCYFSSDNAIIKSYVK